MRPCPGQAVDIVTVVAGMMDEGESPDASPPQVNSYEPELESL